MAPPPAVPSILLKDFTLVLIRLIAGGSLIFFHAWGEVAGEFNHFFGPRRPWALPDLIASAGFPYGLALASVLSPLAFAAASVLVIGLLSRLAALILLIIAGLVIGFAYADWLRELAIAYSCPFLILLLMGPGRLAVDSLFTRRRRLEHRNQFRPS